MVVKEGGFCILFSYHPPRNIFGDSFTDKGTIISNIFGDVSGLYITALRDKNASLEWFLIGDS